MHWISSILLDYIGSIGSKIELTAKWVFDFVRLSNPIERLEFDWVRLVFCSVLFDWIGRDGRWCVHFPLINTMEETTSSLPLFLTFALLCMQSSHTIGVVKMSTVEGLEKSCSANRSAMLDYGQQCKCKAYAQLTT